MSSEPEGVGIAEILQACDALTDRLEQYLSEREAELPLALAGGDHRRIYRVERAITWTQDLIDLIDDDVLDRIGALRHNDHQLKWAREGKMV